MNTTKNDSIGNKQTARCQVTDLYFFHRGKDSLREVQRQIRMRQREKAAEEGVGCKQPTSSAPFSGDRLLEVDFPIPYRECDIRYIGSFELNSDLF